MAIPISGISRIEPVEMNVQVKKGDKKTPALLENTFEIFLKEEFLDLYLRTDYESLFCQDAHRKNALMKNIQKSEKIYHSPSRKNLKEKFLLEEADTPDMPLNHAAMHSLNTHSGAWSNRVGMWPLSDRKLVFTTRKEEVAQQWLYRLQNLLNGVDPSQSNLKDDAEDEKEKKAEDTTDPFSGDDLLANQTDDGQGIIISC